MSWCIVYVLGLRLPTSMCGICPEAPSSLTHPQIDRRPHPPWITHLEKHKSPWFFNVSMQAYVMKGPISVTNKSKGPLNSYYLLISQRRPFAIIKHNSGYWSFISRQEAIWRPHSPLLLKSAWNKNYDDLFFPYIVIYYIRVKLLRMKKKTKNIGIGRNFVS